MNQYESFLKLKSRSHAGSGFSLSDSDFNQSLFPFQRDLVRWALRMGKAAIFADTGLGKTAMMLEWSKWVHRETGQNVIIVAPLAVSSQTFREGVKFGIDVNICRELTHLKPGINITNYERIHKFDLNKFSGVVLDESSILKSYTGMTKQLLVRSFANTPYRLCCTATPAPNDYLELGNHSEFLGVMPSNEMISRWFLNDSMKMGSYKLRPHGERDFWRWMASWGVCITSPSDLGHDGSAFVLPPLTRTFVELDSQNCRPPDGYLFHTLDVSATSVHKVKRSTSSERAKSVGNLIGDDPESWLVWCDTNYEADEVKPLVHGIVEIRGSDTVERKESRLIGFSDGTIKRLLTKPEVAGHGMNWQHCNRMAFMGVSFSFERYYQAVRRCWRFGQKRPVSVYIVSTDAESSVLKTVLAKESAFIEMRQKMIDAVKEDQLESIYGGRVLSSGSGSVQIHVPNWLRSKSWPN